MLWDGLVLKHLIYFINRIFKNDYGRYIYAGNGNESFTTLLM